METKLQESLSSFPVTALLGPRQCGKSTLAVLKPDHTWIVAPVLEPYLKDPHVTVANIKAVLQDLANRR